VAEQIGVSQVLILSLQGIRAAAGNMVVIKNIGAFSATYGCFDAGGKIIRINAIPALY